MNDLQTQEGHNFVPDILSIWQGQYALLNRRVNKINLPEMKVGPAEFISWVDSYIFWQRELVYKGVKIGVRVLALASNLIEPNFYRGKHVMNSVMLTIRVEPTTPGMNPASAEKIVEEVVKLLTANRQMTRQENGSFVWWEEYIAGVNV